MSIVSWLHISDLHLNTPGFSSSFLRDELPKFLVKSGISCDYVFCTGDLRDATKGAFPSDNGHFLMEICKATGGKLFVVPGNHDVERGTETEARHKTIQHIQKYYRSEEGIIEPEDLEILYESEKAFREYVSPLAEVSNDPLYPHFNIVTEHFNILHVDTTLTYTIGHETNLIIGTDSLYKAIKTIDPSKPTILLTHYSYMMLTQKERKFIEELLYRHGIQLWLAGHEHEHNLRPNKYLHSIQSGELRLEDDCNTSVLVGEYNTEQYRGKIKAYSWFNEGWYLYPAIWHGETKDDEYPFTLALQANGKLKSLEAINSQKHNQRYKHSGTLIDSLFADIETDEGKVYQGRNGLIKCANDMWAGQKHLILIADGGMGKTTRLLSTCDILDGKTALYIPLDRVEPESLIQDICRALFNESSEERLYQYAKNRFTDPNVYLFLDGMNEVDGKHEKEIIDVIKKIAQTYPGIQMVISSRSNFTERYRLDGFSVAYIKPLRIEQIQTMFTKVEWERIEISPPLAKLVQNPLMATLYKRISPEMGKYNSFINWIENITNETELIYDYYMTQIVGFVCKDINVVQYIQCCLPFIAYCFEHLNKHTMSIDDFRKLLEQAVGLNLDESVERIRRELRVGNVSSIDSFALEDYLINISHLIHKSEGNVSFPHQIHRDYLSAVWLTKTPEIEKCWNERCFTNTISDYIHHLCRNDYWNGLAGKIMNIARGREDCRNLLINVMNTFPYTESSGQPDFSHLDFRGIRIPDYAYGGEKIKLANVKIDEYSIGCEAGNIVLFSCLAFSPNNEYLAGIAEGELIVYSMDTGRQIFKESISSDNRQMDNVCADFSFDSRFIFIRIRDDLMILKNAKEIWERIGIISDAYTSNLHHVIVHDSLLSFYYTKEIKSYSLNNAELVEMQKSECNKHVIEGEDIVNIQPSRYPKGEEQYSASVSADGQYRVVCYQDGRLTVYYKSGKVLHNLENGKGVLKTASISKDGNRAVMLSANTYDGKRRIQFWDLDNRQKVEERFCNATTKAVYLTDHGDWIIGTDGNITWFWNWANKDSYFTRYERFISETKRGVTTYGNCLLYQTSDGVLMELDLDSRSSRALEVYPPIRYATALPDGRIAIVRKSSKFVELKSTTGDQILKINNENSKISNVHAFNQQPFIAVLTGGIISMYHVRTGQRTRKLYSSMESSIITAIP